jgi:hypothetical protein
MSPKFVIGTCFLQTKYDRKLNGSLGRRGAAPLPPPSAEASFRKLLAAQGKKLPPAAPPSFVKKLDSIPEIELPPDHPMR